MFAVFMPAEEHHNTPSQYVKSWLLLLCHGQATFPLCNWFLASFSSWSPRNALTHDSILQIKQERENPERELKERSFFFSCCSSSLLLQGAGSLCLSSVFLLRTPFSLQLLITVQKDARLGLDLKQPHVYLGATCLLINGGFLDCAEIEYCGLARKDESFFSCVCNCFGSELGLQTRELGEWLRGL